MTKEEGRIKLQTLIDNFEYEFVNQPATIRRDYNEATVRAKFLDPFFEALGWDMRGKEAHVEYSQTREDDGSKGRADYFFTLGTGKEFYVEAKKPAENLADNPHHFMQARRYAYSAKHPVTILSDFEEFFVYLGRGAEPKPSDSQNTARVDSLSCTFSDYLNKWDEIWQYFSRDNVMQGSLETIPGVAKDAKGSTAVDSLFLSDIESWRKLLAENIHKNNPSFSRRLLNELVQRTIDRIIFLRICEDREIEEYGRILKLKDLTGIYDGLKRLFKQADDRYNSGLFHFKKEKGREDFDETSLGLVIDDEPLQTIITRLYWPGGPYAFAAMPADILGQVYERFLGKVIEINGDTVTVEDKPEVKKAGGVFYTPEYIVDYIVKNTVGQFLNPLKATTPQPPPYKPEGGGAFSSPPVLGGAGGGKVLTPAEVAKLRILDPACGSGAFLINAYQYLLDWYLDWYKANTPEKWIGKDKPLMKDEQGIYRLTLAERKRILLANIYGVDIDSQAVEVTRLSLLLKCLEGETRRDLQMQLFTERLLPDLDANIKCGNSLIGRDFYHDKQPGLFGLEEKLKINVFDWQSEFAGIMTAGGFDCVIGNPPYSYMILAAEQEYFSSKYVWQDYQKDLYLLFLERYQLLLKETGLLGVIVSNTWLQSITLRKIRQHLASSYRWLNVLYLPDKVFKAVVDTHVLIFQKVIQKAQNEGNLTVYTRRDLEIVFSHYLPLSGIPTNGDPINIVANSAKQNLFTKITDAAMPLTAFCTVFNGVKPFEKGKGTPPQTAETMRDKPFVKEGAKPDESWTPLLRGSLIHRYRVLWDNNYWIQYGPWLAAPRNASIFFDAPEKIMVRQTGDSIIATFVGNDVVARNNLHVLLPDHKQISLHYVLALLNSKVMDFAYTSINPEKGEALAEVKKQHVEQLPIRTINFDDPAEKKQHDDLVILVNFMLKHHKDLQAPGLDSQSKKIMQNEIADTDRQINALVYQLYGLTAEEIAIVEGTA
jgi:adenine-specific DNA-methyltransferase